MDPVIVIALILGALNVGFLGGRVFERLDYSRKRQEEKEAERRAHG